MIVPELRTVVGKARKKQASPHQTPQEPPDLPVRTFYTFPNGPDMLVSYFNFYNFHINLRKGEEAESRALPRFALLCPV